MGIRTNRLTLFIPHSFFRDLNSHSFQNIGNQEDYAIQQFLTIKDANGATVDLEAYRKARPEMYEHDMHGYQFIVNPGKDFSFAHEALTASDPKVRLNIIPILAILSEHPLNALSILDLLKNVFTLDPQPPPTSPPKSSKTTPHQLNSTRVEINTKY